MRYIINLSYNGADFHGWQVQPSAVSVQGCLEKALSTLLRSEIAVTGAGRTDSGVNAIAYVAHFDAEAIAEPRALCYKLNAILPKSIVVHSIAEADSEFHARFDATRREYTYFLHRVKDPFVLSFSYLCQYPELDFALMNEAAALLLGRHDFRCFEKSGADSKTSVCTVFAVGWKEYRPCPCAWGDDDGFGADGPGLDGSAGADGLGSAEGLGAAGADGGFEAGGPGAAGGSRALYWKFEIAADRFLRNMVRAVVGTLLEVGRGKRSLEEFARLVLEVEDCDGGESGDGADVGGDAGVDAGASSGNCAKSSQRSLAGESVPGHALFLTKVKY